MENCKLALPIQVSYLRAPTTQLTRPVISSAKPWSCGSSVCSPPVSRGKRSRAANPPARHHNAGNSADDKQFSQLKWRTTTPCRNVKEPPLRTQGSQPEWQGHSHVRHRITMLSSAIAPPMQQPSRSSSPSWCRSSHAAARIPPLPTHRLQNAWGMVKTANRADRSYIKELFSECPDLSRVADVVARAIPKASKEVLLTTPGAEHRSPGSMVDREGSGQHPQGGRASFPKTKIWCRNALPTDGQAVRRKRC